MRSPVTVHRPILLFLSGNPDPIGLDALARKKEESVAPVVITGRVIERGGHF